MNISSALGYRPGQNLPKTQLDRLHRRAIMKQPKNRKPSTSMVISIQLGLNGPERWLTDAAWESAGVIGAMAWEDFGGSRSRAASLSDARSYVGFI